MKVYVFQAALLCEECGDDVVANLPKPAGFIEGDESSFDSDAFPKGPYGNGGGEADCPQHCDYCRTFLENPLTPDGDAYARNAVKEYDTEPDMSFEEMAQAAEAAGAHAVAQWARYYFAFGQ